MAKVIAKTALTVVTFIVIILNLIFFVIDNNLYTLENLPKGESVETIRDLGKPYVLTFYRVNAGGNLGCAWRGEVMDTVNGETYTVFWETGVNPNQMPPICTWISDTEVSIGIGKNEDIVINLEKDGYHYDCRTKDESPYFFNNTKNS